MNVQVKKINLDKIDELIDKVYQTIPPSVIQAIEKKKKKGHPTTSMLSITAYLPKKWYAIFEYYGAFEEGAGAYLRQLAYRDLVMRIHAMKGGGQ